MFRKIAIEVEEEPFRRRLIRSTVGRIVSPYYALREQDKSFLKHTARKKGLEHVLRAAAKDKDLKDVKIRFGGARPIADLKRAKGHGKLTKLYSSVLDFGTNLVRADEYNPITKTVSLHTHSPRHLAHTLGLAKVFKKRNNDLKMLYARDIPVIGHFSHANTDREARKEAIKLLMKTKEKKRILEHRQGFAARHGANIGEAIAEAAGTFSALPIPGLDIAGGFIGRSREKARQKAEKGHTKKAGLALFSTFDKIAQSITDKVRQQLQEQVTRRRKPVILTSTPPTIPQPLEPLDEQADTPS